MKVLNPLETTLANAEVHTFLSALIQRHESHPDFTEQPAARLRRLHRVTNDVVSYFEASEEMTGILGVLRQESELQKSSITAVESDAATQSTIKDNGSSRKLTGFKPYDILAQTNHQTSTTSRVLQSRITEFLTLLQNLPTRNTNTNSNNSNSNVNSSDKLTKAEALMMVNVIPIDEPVLECVIEEVEERYDEAQREEMMRLCRWFGNVVNESEGEGENGENGGGEADEAVGDGDGEIDG